MRTTPQKSTQSTEPRDLTPKQTQLVNALAHGSSVTDAAKLADVDRTTVYLWMKTDALFVAELNRTRQEARDALQARLGELAAQAIDTVRDLMTGDATPPHVRLTAALQVLEAFGTLQPQGIGATDPEAVERDRRHAEAMQRRSDYFDSLTP